LALKDVWQPYLQVKTSLTLFTAASGESACCISHKTSFQLVDQLCPANLLIEPKFFKTLKGPQKTIYRLGLFKP